MSINFSSYLRSGFLPVAAGGTGTSSLTGIVKGSGTSAFTTAIAADFPTLNQDTSGTAAKASNLVGGTAGNIVYQTGVNTTSFVGNGTSGQVLKSNGTSAPTWIDQSALNVGSTISDDLSTDNSFYLIFTTTTSGKLTSASISSSKLYFNPNTGILNVTNLNSLSDVNLKTNITPIVDAISIIKQINAVEFDWKDTGKHSSGVIAQQLETILPFLVDTNTKGEKSVNYNGLIGYLISAVSELSNQLNTK